MDAMPGIADICGDEEALPFAPHSFDLIVNPLTLHTVNDLPGALIQIRRALKPDGFFIGALFGGDTLHELRTSLMQAEMNISGGVSPRVAPMAGRRDLAALMQRAGFALPVVDAETVTVMYRDIFHLMHDLRGMGHTNSLAARRRTMTARALFLEAECIYRENYGVPGGKIPATFEIIYLNGWAPHESQQKPLRRGSAEHSLTDALEC
jgi:SAM-dependent methyltransferase